MSKTTDYGEQHPRKDQKGVDQKVARTRKYYVRNRTKRADLGKRLEKLAATNNIVVRKDLTKIVGAEDIDKIIVDEDTSPLLGHGSISARVKRRSQNVKRKNPYTPSALPASEAEPEASVLSLRVYALLSSITSHEASIQAKLAAVDRKLRRP
jgi:hypothetical protein